MLVYQTPMTSLNRLLLNDKSTEFKIIFQIKQTKEHDDIIIEKQKEIIFKTTINKARVISKVINEKYIKDQSIDEHVFPVSKMNQMKISDIIDVVSTLIQRGGDQLIQEEKAHLYEQIMAIFDTDMDTIEYYKIIECQYLENNKFDGIISYLLKKSNGHDDDLKISTGSITSYYYDSMSNVSNLLLLSDFDKGFFGVGYRNSAWIEYDFGNRKINMTSYTIQSLFRSPYQYQPKTWKFMGSNDHDKWEMIDFKSNNDVLNKGYFNSHFECVRKGKYYRYIRYVQMGNWNISETYKYSRNDRYSIALSSIEFFGTISISSDI